MLVLRTLLVSLALLLAGGAVLGVATSGFQAFTTEAARRIAVHQNPIAVPAVTLQIESSARIDFSSLQGKWLLVDFIYTRCSSYCVALGAEFAQLQNRLAGPIEQGKVQLLSISFDPDHDTPAQLAAYLRRSHDRGHGWHAGRPIGANSLLKLKRAFGITVIADGLGGYTHNVAIHLIDPGGRLVDIFDAGDLARVELAVSQAVNR